MGARLGDVLAELEAHPDVTVSYRRGKDARMRQVYHALDSCLSVLNEAGSVVFTFVTLRAFRFALAPAAPMMRAGDAAGSGAAG